MNRPRPDSFWQRTSRRDRALDDVIVSLTAPGERVLDIGCGRGELLERLRAEKAVREQGLEIDGGAVSECIARGLSVVQGDLGESLLCYQDYTFDLAIANQVLPALRDPVGVIGQALRVARRVAVTIPNFSHWRIRSQLFLMGRLPMTESLPYRWHETPHIRYFTVLDFRSACLAQGWPILSEHHRDLNGGAARDVMFWPNLRASLSLFLLGTAA